MSLKEKVEALVEALVDVLGALPANTEAETEEEEKPKGKGKKPAPKPKGRAKAKVIEDDDDLDDDDDDDDDDEEEKPKGKGKPARTSPKKRGKTAEAQAKDIALKLIKDGERKAVMKIFSAYGGKSIADIDEDDYDEVLADLKELAEELDED